MLAAAFLRNGHPTTVWNRTSGKADELVSQGATVADTAADAVEASPLVIVCVLDYNAVYAILENSAASLKGRTLVNLTSGSPDGARQMAARAADGGFHYLDGAMIVPAIGQPEASILYSGSEHAYLTHQRTLTSLGGTASYLGTDPGRAAAYDVALLDIFWTAMTGYIHALALASAENITATRLVPYARSIIGMMPDIMAEFANQVDNSHYPGMNPISSPPGL
nr:NAD(P)-binding domain-containing protein [Paenibacillus arenilitoris]